MLTMLNIIINLYMNVFADVYLTVIISPSSEVAHCLLNTIAMVLMPWTGKFVMKLLLSTLKSFIGNDF